MSRGFVKEDDQELIPIVPPRADLPNGMVNYLTPNGMDELLQEKETLLHEIETVQNTDENERRIAINYINAKLQLLNQRIASGKVVDLDKQPHDEIRFGALISMQIGNDTKIQKYQIVGVDEANIAKAKISFISPIARILVNKKVGDVAVLKLAKEDREFKILGIEY
ncbi:GreA/GreB family elongation factor [Flavobacterium frigidarium]|uniref:GreA/GreB family elongation factor n=1 Tax=Flavobacterium frigidarium TaxID=99286 RepID=UPI00041982AB|nr:GreA/GreB family elongation factor [Flavobacterium frigidarium]